LSPPRPQISDKLEVYSLSIKDASLVFGLATGTLYNWINNGKLIRGLHYLKISNKPLIKRKEFIKWLEEEDGCA